MQTKLWSKIRYMVMLSNRVIYDKIEQGLMNILDDFVIEKCVRLRI